MTRFFDLTWAPRCFTTPGDLVLLIETILGFRFVVEDFNVIGNLTSFDGCLAGGGSCFGDCLAGVGSGFGDG